MLVCVGRRLKSVKGQHLGEIYWTVGGMKRQAQPQPPLLPGPCTIQGLQTLIHLDHINSFFDQAQSIV